MEGGKVGQGILEVVGAVLVHRIGPVETYDAVERVRDIDVDGDVFKFFIGNSEVRTGDRESLVVFEGVWNSGVASISWDFNRLQPRSEVHLIGGDI